MTQQPKETCQRTCRVGKPCYLENCVVREPCKQRTACSSPHDFHTMTLNFRKVRRAYQNRWDSRCQLLLCCVNPGNRKGRVSQNYEIILSFLSKSVKDCSGHELDKANFSCLELILNGFVAFCILTYILKN